MKKKILMIVVLLASMTSLFADNNLTAPAVTIPQGGTGVINIELNNEKAYTAFTMKLTLPNGISYSSFSKSDRFADSHSVSATPNGQTISFGCLSTSNESISGTSGVLLSVTVSADESLAVGSEHVAVISNANFSTTSGEETLDNVNVTITIGENRIVLDENSTTAPAAANEVNVKVMRTITAGVWNTICLPFAMTAAQVTTVFGDDVQLAEFKGWETTEYNDDDDPTAISVSFANVTAIEANTPYIIKVSTALTEFTVDGVDIDPEEDPAVTVGKKSKGTLGSFTGSYVPVTIEEECLFLNNNKFWYSKGNTSMKGYRAYFYFQDVLAEYTATAGARIIITDNNDGGATGIQTPKTVVDEFYYNLNGQRVEKPKKGLYIHNGKKEVVK